MTTPTRSTHTSAMFHVQPGTGLSSSQLDLLSSSPIARRRDPSTSHEAAEKITASGKRASQQNEVLRMVRVYPGCTSFELAGGDLERRFMFARRLPELRKAGLIRNSIEKRVCKITGLNALVWYEV